MCMVGRLGLLRQCNSGSNSLSVRALAALAGMLTVTVIDIMSPEFSRAVGDAVFNVAQPLIEVTEIAKLSLWLPVTVSQ